MLLRQLIVDKTRDDVTRCWTVSNRCGWNPLELLTSNTGDALAKWLNAYLPVLDSSGRAHKKDDDTTAK